MKTLVELKSDVLKEIERMMKYFEVPMVNVVYDLDSIQVLGQYHNKYSRTYKTPTIRLNEILLKEFGDVYIGDVVIHEFAHHVICSLYPTSYNGRKKVRSHGTEWKTVCWKLGLNSAKATTNLYETSSIFEKKRKRKSTTFIYTCGCEGKKHEITKHRHTKILDGSGKYRCNVCGERITFTGESCVHI